MAQVQSERERSVEVDVRRRIQDGEPRLKVRAGARYFDQAVGCLHLGPKRRPIDGRLAVVGEGGDTSMAGRGHPVRLCLSYEG